MSRVLSLPVFYQYIPIQWTINHLQLVFSFKVKRILEELKCLLFLERVIALYHRN